MRRIVCLWVRQLPLAAALRVEPDLRDRPVAISAGRGPRSPIVALSPLALARGVAPAMTAAQARAACPTLTVRPASREALTAAGDALADVAETVSPRVELDADGTVFLDATGCFTLCASEPELATVLGARAERQGLPVSVGIAGSKPVARIAAREGEGVRIVAAGDERAYLARLSLDLLDPSATVAATLAAWGLCTMGDLAALPAGEVAHRLGPEGARIARQARGTDDEPLRARARPRSFVEAVELDYALDRLEPALFVLRRLVERLTARLALHGMACDALELRLRLADGGHDLRPIAVAAPTAETKVLLTLLRADLERRPPTAGVNGIVLTGRPAPVRPTQLDFFQPRGPAPEALAATIARLAALCGPDRVGAPRCVDSHRPDAAGVMPFVAPASAGANAHSDTPRDVVATEQGTATAERVTAAARVHGTATDPVAADTGAHADTAVVARVALRAFRPPAPLEVFESAGRLEYVRGPTFGGRVVHCAGPWRLCGEWWTADPYARAYYDVELTDGGVYRIYHDARARRWRADGAYD